MPCPAAGTATTRPTRSWSTPTTAPSLQSLDALRGQALVDWVGRGGHLVVAVGANWQAVRDSVLGPILPALPNGQERVTSLEALDSFAGSTKPITPPGTPPVMVTKLEEVEERGGKVLSIMGNLPAGRPRAARLRPGDADRARRRPEALRRLARPGSLLGAGARPEARARRLRPAARGSRAAAGGSTSRASPTSRASFASRLEQFPGVKLIPFGWVAFFIFLYILLIGPGDYFFLKKVLKRMELTWITFPTIVVTVSLLAYFAAYRLKGNDLLVNKVDVVDVDQAGGPGAGPNAGERVQPAEPRLRHRASCPSPRPGPRGSPAGRPRAPRASRRGRRRHRGRDDLVQRARARSSAAWGARAAGSASAAAATRTSPPAALERLENVRIPIWSTKTITAAWFGPAGPLVEADLQPVGTDRLAGTVTNRQSYPAGRRDPGLRQAGLPARDAGPRGDGPGRAVQRPQTSPGSSKSKAPNYLSDQPRQRKHEDQPAGPDAGR